MQRLGIMRDARHALRMLIRTPAFSLIAILTFAVGIGANTAVFSVVDGVLLRGLPYPDSDRITMVWVDNRREKIKEDINSYPNYRDWRDQNSSYQQLAKVYIFPNCSIHSSLSSGKGDCYAMLTVASDFWLGTLPTNVLLKVEVIK